MGRRRWVAPCRGQLNILSHRSNGGIHISARPLCWPATISLRNIIIFHIRGNGKFSTRIFLRTFVSLLLFLLLFLVQVAVWTVSPTLLNREQYQVAIIKKEVKERTVTKHFFFLHSHLHNYWTEAARSFSHRSNVLFPPLYANCGKISNERFFFFFSFLFFSPRIITQ